MTHYHLDDLSSINADTQKPARFAVIGNPVAHSLSPQLHQPALDALELNVRYIRVEVPEGRVAEAFEKMHEVGIQGINVTVPHKLEALDACDEVGKGARLMGAVNTIVFEGEKKVGFNTDGPGFVRAIREDFGLDLGDLRIVIIGAGGGAGRAIATQCCLEDCPQLTLANRTVEKLTSMQTLLDPLLHGEKLEGPGDRLSSNKVILPLCHRIGSNLITSFTTRSTILPAPGSCVTPKLKEPGSQMESRCSFIKVRFLWNTGQIETPPLTQCAKVSLKRSGPDPLIMNKIDDLEELTSSFSISKANTKSDRKILQKRTHKSLII